LGVFALPGNPSLISIDATALIISALVFGLVFVLKNAFFEPLANAMETRQDRVERAASAWDDAQQTIANSRAEVDAAVQETRNVGYRLLDEARSGAQQETRTELDAGRTTAHQQIVDAKKRLSDEADQAVLKLESDAETLASQIASRILGREVS
jgi:F0F1-type ATP synthase membrane subunit b/b'